MSYYVSVETRPIYDMANVSVLRDHSSAYFETILEGCQTLALCDTGGASSSYICYEYYNTIQGLPELKRLNLRSASGNNLLPLCLVNYSLTVGGEVFFHDFIVCKHLTKLVITAIGLSTNEATLDGP